MNLELIAAGANAGAHLSAGLGINEYFSERNERIKASALGKLEAMLISYSPDFDSLLILSPEVDKLMGGHRGIIHAPYLAIIPGIYTSLRYGGKDLRSKAKAFLYGAALNLSHTLIDAISGGKIATLWPGFNLKNPFWNYPENLPSIALHLGISAIPLGYILLKMRRNKE
jgi:membrane-bound metal-dependent hydrolase YbcI (DUF457 family)